MIFGINGACRRNELWKLRVSDIEDLNSAVLIKLSDTKTKITRSFTVTGAFYDVYKKYAALRPPGLPETRFFLNYINGKCTRQVVGINKFGRMPQEIASFLKLPSPELYTGHTFRRSSATVLVNAGADLLTLKRHGGWRSSSVAEGYIDDSVTIKTHVAQKIMNSVQSCGSNSLDYISDMDNSDPNMPSTSAKNDLTITENLLSTQTPGITIQNCSNFTINYHLQKDPM